MADGQGDLSGAGSAGSGSVGPGSVGLRRTGGIAGLTMSASVLLSDLPAAAADRTRDLAERVLAERGAAAAGSGGQVRDGMSYELLIALGEGAAADRVVARDGALTPAQQDLIEILRPHLSPE